MKPPCSTPVRANGPGDESSQDGRQSARRTVGGMTGEQNRRVWYLICRSPSLSVAGWRRRVFKSGGLKQRRRPAKQIKRSRIGRKCFGLLVPRCFAAVLTSFLFRASLWVVFRWVTCRTEENRQETTPSHQPASDLIISGKKAPTSNGPRKWPDVCRASLFASICIRWVTADVHDIALLSLFSTWLWLKWLLQFRSELFFFRCFSKIFYIYIFYLFIYFTSISFKTYICCRKTPPGPEEV